MESTSKKPLRCAIYTRKSTDHNLDLEFNSLDAQREACEAFIKSQGHEGWRLVPGHYDDGAFSGASLERPALQRLLTEVKASKVDVIVVYKVDRLTRSLSDFAKLVELFDQHSVSFVSVTQSFNTTSSMGRLTLNVLLSFAQFEREVIGERVRDKIAASKAKGIWVGGSIPMGYAVIDKKVAVVPDEAKTVRLIFERYVEIGSIGLLAADLDRKEIRTRRQTLSTGKVRGGIRFNVGTLGYLLRNRFYIGEVVYKGKIHRGEHEPILQRTLFDAVQAKLAAGANERLLRTKASPALLAGRIFDTAGNRMTPTHTNKKGARYRYYVSHRALQNGRVTGGAVRASAPDLEAAITGALRRHLAAYPELPAHNHELIQKWVERIVVRSGEVEIQLSPSAHEEQRNTQSKRQRTRVTNSVTIAWKSGGLPVIKGIAGGPSSPVTAKTAEQEMLLRAIAKARSWIETLTAGTTSLDEIAKHERKCERHIRLLAPLAFASPALISALAEGSTSQLTVTGLAKRMPYSWGRTPAQTSSTILPVPHFQSIASMPVRKPT